MDVGLLLFELMMCLLQGSDAAVAHHYCPLPPKQGNTRVSRAWAMRPYNALLLDCRTRQTHAFDEMKKASWLNARAIC